MKNKAIWPGMISFIVGLGILVVKFIAAHWSGSMALRSDALESVVNVVGAGLTLGSLAISSLRPDANHPYGHGKIQNFSASFTGAAMALGAFWIISESLSHSPQLGQIGTQDWVWSLGLNAVGGLGNGLLGLYLMRVGRKAHDNAVVADGQHVFSDFITTLVLFFGLILAKVTGLWWIDRFLALGVGLLLGLAGMRLVYGAAMALLDTEDPELIAKISEWLNQHRGPEVIAVHGLRTMRSGPLVHVDWEVVVPEYFPLREAHDRIDYFSQQLKKVLAREVEFHTHLDPCRQEYCRECSMPDCPIRLDPFQAHRDWGPDTLTQPEESHEQS